MSLNLKFRTCFITFILVVSSLSIFVILPDDVNASESDIEKLLYHLSGMHPFLTAGWYEYNGTESIKIKGSITFNLYYSSTLATQLKYKDEVKVTLYSWDQNSLLFPFPREIKNGNTTITLKPEKFGDIVQNQTVTLKNISHTLREGEILIFAVEVIHSDKPIGNIVERRYERKLKANLGKIGEFLNQSSDEQLQELGNIILGILEISEEYGITGEEIANLADSFSSSSFVYNSEDYPSSVTFPHNSTNSTKLYFRSAWDDTYSDADTLTFMSKELPNGTATTWPTRLSGLDTSGSDMNTEGWMLWLGFWLEYIMMESYMKEDENLITYYLDSENKLTTEDLEGYSPKRISLKKPQTWESEALIRNKIIKNATAELYLFYPRIITLRNFKINATIFDGDTAIASVIKKIDRTSLIEILQRGPYFPTEFIFEDAIDKEIWNGNNISLKLTASKGPLFSLRPIYLMCDSKDYASSLAFKFEETKNIQITDDLEDKYVIPGGSAEFILNITSKYEDTIDITVTPEGSTEWSIEHPESVDIAENGNVKVHVIVTSTDDTIAAEGDLIDLNFTAAGSTGIDIEGASVEVSKEAVEYAIDIDLPADKEIKHGKEDTYTFKIKNNNTGVWPDRYKIEASSEHNWSVEVVDHHEIQGVKIGEQLSVNVTVFVPWYTDINTDILELTVYSIESGETFSTTVNVTTTVINPNILEAIYHFFESVAEDIGLDDALGSYAAGFLIFILIFIIFIFLISAIYIIKKKYIEVVCLERIKDVDPEEEAIFDITIQNPSKKTLTYEIHKEVIDSESDSWDVSIDKTNVVIGPKQSSPVVLTVKPKDYVKSDDWIEVKVSVRAVEKDTTAEVSTVTSIKDGKPDIKITGVFHWPRMFKKGDKVETSFRLTNNGNTSAKNISVILFVNGEEKNKVEDITIPRGGYAEIEIPWIAGKGKNEVNIVVK